MTTGEQTLAVQGEGCRSDGTGWKRSRKRQQDGPVVFRAPGRMTSPACVDCRRERKGVGMGSGPDACLTVVRVPKEERREDNRGVRPMG